MIKTSEVADEDKTLAQEMLREPHAHSESLNQKAWRRFRRHRLAMAGLVVVLAMIAMAILAPVLGGYPRDATDLDVRGQSPSRAHLLGTDMAGRDLFTRLLYGARISMSVGLIATTFRMVIAIILGGVSGLYGGRVDNLIMRFTDAVMLFPTFPVIMIVMSYVSPSVFNVMVVLGILGWEGTARLVRGQILQLKNADYILASRCLGVKNRHIIVRHLLPNIMSVLVVTATFGVAGGVLTEAGLSFLGLGVPPPTPSWGNMMQDAQSLNIMATRWWLWIFPGLATSLFVLSVNFIGDGLRDALDPYMTL